MKLDHCLHVILLIIMPYLFSFHRDELDVFSAEVIRFGNLCKDPVWHNLGRYFQK